MFALHADAVVVGNGSSGADLTQRPLKRDSMGETSIPRCRTTRESNEPAQTREIPSCCSSTTLAVVQNKRFSAIIGIRWFERHVSSRFRVTSRELVLPAFGMFFFYVCHDALQGKFWKWSENVVMVSVVFSFSTNSTIISFFRKNVSI